MKLSGITELAKLLKERENSTEYTPMFGTIIELPEIKIRINEKVILTNSHLKFCINISEQNADGDYIYFGREVVLLPFANTQKFIVIGVGQ